MSTSIYINKYYHYNYYTMIDLDYDSDSITYITNLHETGIQG